MKLNEIASAVFNNLTASGMIPLSQRTLMSIEQIEDEIVEERSTVIKEWYLKGLLDKHDLMYAINCIEVDCADQNKCPSCRGSKVIKKASHFEIPQLIDGLGSDAVAYIGSTDRAVSFRLYFSMEAAAYNKYRKRNTDKPYVYIEKTPNENGMYDGWIFNAPFIKSISIIGIFKDPRKLSELNCCSGDEYLEFGSISNEVAKRVLEKKLRVFRVQPIPAPQSI